jgi:maltooligosyltrehalose trehalohydrolase
MIFSLWAPLAASVEMVVGAGRYAMERGSDEVWRLEMSEDLASDGYRFSLDGGEPVPDPRSAWQPDGVHGASWPIAFTPPREPLAAQFRQRPLAEALIYELHVGTFTPAGTYAAAAAKLPHLAELGVTHVELMPLGTFPGQHGWGYDGVDLYAPFPGYGTPRELASFVSACHAQGLAVILDVVYNHLGPDGNYLQSSAPYFTERIATGWGPAINFDGPFSDGVRRYVIDNALMWLRDYGFDGLRLDAVHAIFSFEAVHVLEELAAAVRRLGDELGRSLVLIAESDLNDPRLVLPAAVGGFGIDAHWADDFHHSLHRWFTGEINGYYADYDGLSDIGLALRDGYVYQGRYSKYRKRRHGRAPLGIRPDQLVVSAQNHDQIGNRAFGDRLSMMLSPSQLKAVAALLLLSPFVPMLFQGEEWGAATPFLYFTDHRDPVLARNVAEGRRKEFAGFGWEHAVPDPQEPATFTRSKLDWSELRRPRHADLLAWHHSLMRIRRQKPPSTALPPAEVRMDEQARWMTVAHGGVQSAFNFSGHLQSVPLQRGDWRVALSTDAPREPSQAMGPGDTRIYVEARATRLGQ